MIYIVAGNYQQYQKYVNMTGLISHYTELDGPNGGYSDNGDVRALMTHEQALSLDRPRVIIVGNPAQQLPAYKKIMERLNAVNAVITHAAV